MLFDPKWTKKTKANPLSVGGLVAWLERQPAETRYFFSDPENCLIAQYLTTSGYVAVGVGGFTFSHGYHNRRRHEKLPSGFTDIAAAFPRTYGAALERARAHS